MVTSAPIAVTMGDPAGCGPIMVRKAWRHFNNSDEVRFFVIGPADLYETSGPVRCISSPKEAAAHFSQALPVLTLSNDVGRVTPGAPAQSAAPAILESIERATAMCLSNQVTAMVTSPISKAVLYRSGFNYPGHTEFIASLCNASTDDNDQPVMMLVGGGLRVALATIHTPYKDAPALLSRPHLFKLGQIVNQALMQNFGLRAPKLAFAGLNPHAGESGTIGQEEINIINPAALALREAGINISDARPGDTVFHEALQGEYDAIIAMTHDQGLIPVKTLDMWGGVNTTLGLPIIRTSPDHGTAYDAARTGNVRSDSLIAAIKLASEMATTRQSAHA